MKKSYDFNQDWPKLKKQLMEFSQDALSLAKKGEAEVLKFSKRGKLHFDSTALQLKREHICHSIGKEYIKAQCPGPHTPELKKFITQLSRVDRDIEVLKKRLAGKAGATKGTALSNRKSNLIETAPSESVSQSRPIPDDSKP